MSQTLKLFLVPGSVQFLAIGLLAGIALLYCGERARRWGRAWLTGIVLAYLVLSTPAGADFIAAPLVRQHGSIKRAAEARGIDTVVAVTTGTWVYQADGFEVDEMGKSTSHNAMETARVCGLLREPTVIVTGGIVVPGQQRRSEAEVMADGLVRLGIPRERLVLETRSHNTLEQAQNSAKILRERGRTRFVLVTDSAHMPRAMSVFKAQGLDPVPSVSVLKYTVAPGLLYRLRPSIGAYQQSDRAAYEYFAGAYYWCRRILGMRER